MDIETLSNILLALIIGAFIIVLLEPLHLQIQLNNLRKLINGEKQKPTKGPNIKTNIYQAFVAGAIGLTLFSTLPYLIIRFSALSESMSLKISIVIVVISKVIHSIQIDRVHHNISNHKDYFRK